MWTIGHKIVVKPQKQASQTAGGILLPEDQLKLLPIGEIVQIGHDVTMVEVGNIVMFNEYAGTPIQVDGVDYKVLEEEDVLVGLPASKEKEEKK